MEEAVIRTIPEKCVQCYACIRNCPVKAVAIREGKARIIQERCIQCGNCVKICSQDAKEVLSGIEPTLQALEEGNAVALLAPSYPAAFNGKALKVPAALRAIGFSQVWEVAVGAELVVQACQELDLKKGIHIGSACPAVVNLIEKHYPECIPYLLPFVSPAVATARLIRSLHPGKKQKMVFIGPCIAKKGEIREKTIAGEIHEAITYRELERIFEAKKLNWDQLDEEPFDSPSASLAYTFPISAGLLRNLNRVNDVLQDDCLVIEDQKGWKDTLELIGQKDHPIHLVDGLFCRGCIDGPEMIGGENILIRKQAILNYMRSIPLRDQAMGKKRLLDVRIDLTRSYTDKKALLPYPSEDEIKEILRQTNKTKPQDCINCGACGYSSCREKAIAVYQGIAEIEMCMPYLLKKKNELIESINRELQIVQDLKNELDILIDASYDGIIMTDGQGNIQRVNKQLRELLKMDEEKLIGTNMAELEEQQIVYPSAALMALKTKKTVTFFQQLHTGKRTLATGNPVFDQNGNVTRIICNVRDFDQLEKIKDELYSVRNGPHIGKVDKENSIIALSQEFKRVLDMALRVAIVDSTVLILGESGVGKEVIARYIHQNSPRANGPFVKINCSTLPENLIESELFGYETGAFTGARRQGKPGLFEIADKGTIFLDEIGELPLSQQVKLLQVLQERQIYRLGGLRPRKIDVRLLAATNRDLSDMVAKGFFRADLYYRINVVPIWIPPLRERKDDIIPLIYFFLDRFNEQYQKHCRISKDAKEILVNYSWPGNVRELQNMMERLVVTAGGQVITGDDLPPLLKMGSSEETGVIVKGILPLREAVDEVERQLLLRAQRLYQSTYQMAEALGVNQSTVVRKLKKYEDNAKGNS